jgi:anti-sigma-K factor RskA
MEQQRESARQELAALVAKNGDMQTQIAGLARKRSLDQIQIATLQSKLGDAPNANAVAAWDPETQQGLLKVVNLPPPEANQDYQLWVVDPNYPQPVDGGVFTTTAAGDGRFVFHPKQGISKIAAFAVSREPKGGSEKAVGPIVLLTETK